MRLYADLAPWYPLLTPVEDYVDDAAAVRPLLADALQPGGRLVVMPDFTAESVKEVVEQGGTDAGDGRGLRYLEWSFQRPDGQWVMHLHILLRHPDGSVQSVLESHPFGVFPRAVWTELLEAAGFAVQVVSTGVWEEVFVGIAA